ncbi:putative HicB family RNase H-like nuclease [Methylobacter tundripaludum]|uniref:Putative HicB family RNase H-like nuclease n=1 Tax=Methylobacter tundripaludum TaxID=173365 RepID=A0A2S6H8V6_9GAMM|nr:toxin-antitoxin system HicB family antitoxin [Methylobacter tundripaludum]PPK73898.1 putative HicB family RNase H-like nuclease [Methylobacter tundripaludum]
MFDPSNYTITVRKDRFDGEDCFEARVAELPDVAEYADSFMEAYELAIDTIEVTEKIFSAQGKKMPKPVVQTDDDYSGRVTLRIAKSLHRALAQAANNEGVSLNQHLTNVLNYYTGYAQAASISGHDYEPIWRTSPQVEKQKITPNLRVVRSISAGKIAQYA